MKGYSLGLGLSVTTAEGGSGNNLQDPYFTDDALADKYFTDDATQDEYLTKDA